MKQKILAELLAQIQKEIAVLQGAAIAAKNDATHEESRAEDQHDTRSVEASYLAAGHAKRMADLESLLKVFTNFPLKKFKATDRVDVSALIELEHGGNSQLYFLCPTGGGYKLEVEGKTVNIITEESLLGEELLDRRVGDEVEIHAGKKRVYKIKSIT